MKKLVLILAAALAGPAAAQVAPLNFETGKLLPLASGQWTYLPTATGSEARFGSVLAMRCDRATRVVTIERFGAGPVSLQVATSSVSRALPAGGRLLASDPLLDAIAFSRGRFLVSGGAAGVLAIPAWPEAARSIEDCRS
jgi:hypothetical protein